MLFHQDYSKLPTHLFSVFFLPSYSCPLPCFPWVTLLKQRCDRIILPSQPWWFPDGVQTPCPGCQRFHHLTTPHPTFLRCFAGTRCLPATWNLQLCPYGCHKSVPLQKLIPARMPCPAFNQHWFCVIVQSLTPVSFLTEIVWITDLSTSLYRCGNISHCIILIFIWWYIYVTRCIFFSLCHTWSMMQRYGAPCHVQSSNCVLLLAFWILRCIEIGSTVRLTPDFFSFTVQKSKPFANICTLICGEQ